jgi:hypothetical protein
MCFKTLFGVVSKLRRVKRKSSSFPYSNIMWKAGAPFSFDIAGWLEKIEYLTSPSPSKEGDKIVK